ncbi:hypothetical protein ABT061_43910 [Streptosporangium sp. NPDC002544]|uniref:hypothetical protein n=1 Tax=Streptosporangium sp. NPDC002544 TaxID=3154538 RepID=UPI003325A981
MFIPKGACRLNLQEAWWRIFRRQALAGQTFADPDEIAYVTAMATTQLNIRARPWAWGRPAPRASSASTSFYLPALRNGALAPVRITADMSSQYRNELRSSAIRR